MAFFVFALLLMFVGVVVAVVVRTGGAVAVGIAVFLLGALFVGFDSSTTVASRGVAVQTAFGKVRGNTLGPGFHWVTPWYQVEEFDASVQTLKFYRDEKDDDGTCITVRLGNNTTACTDVTAQWNINHKGDVKGLYLNYRTFDNIHTNLVLRQLQSALNEVFGTYDPLSTVDADGRPQTNTVDLQGKVKAILQRDLGSAIRIDSVTIPIVHFDAPTEDRLRAFQQAKADTRIAEQKTQTAHQQAQANQELETQKSAINDPGVAYFNCLNLVRDLAAQNQLGSLPPTFNCGGTGNAGTLLQVK